MQQWKSKHKFDDRLSTNRTHPHCNLVFVVILRFRRSSFVLVGGLSIIGIYTFISFLYGKVAPEQLGLEIPNSWFSTVGIAITGLLVMLAYSPIADRLANRFFEEPPTLDAFEAIQKSKINLIAGILAAWILGGFLEELIVRGIVLISVEAMLAVWMTKPLITIIAVIVAAVGAGLVHAYQGPLAMVIITQLSILFGILFVVSGYNLWTVIICHGLYDTNAFIRFANKKSKYSNLDQD